MRKIVFLLLVFALAYAYSDNEVRELSNAQAKKNYLYELNKKNKIKNKLTALVPSRKSDFYDGQLTKRETFDKSGRLISSSEYELYADSVYSTYKYDTFGYLMQVTKKASENNALTINYFYDTLGHISSITSYGSERKDYKCKYDKRGNMILKQGYAYHTKFDKSGNVIHNEYDIVPVDEVKYKYDRENNLISEKVKINGKLIRTTTYKYNKQNLIIKEINKYLGNRVTYIYKYDKDLKLVEYVRYNINGTKSYFKVEYEYFDGV